MTKPVASKKRRIISICLLCCYFYGFIVGFLYLNQRALIYQPLNEKPDVIIGQVPDIQIIQVQPADMNQALSAWYQPPTDPKKPVMIFFHGNGGNIQWRTWRTIPLMKKGYGVLLAEYRGYGGNPGEPTEQGLYSDAEAYYQFLLKSGIPENRMVMYGESLGTGVATYMANKYQGVAGLILDGGYTSLVDIAKNDYFFVPVKLLMIDRYPSIDRIGNVKAPILIMHGEKDSIIPVRFSRALYAQATSPKTLKIYPEGAHADLYNHGAFDAVFAFLESLKI
jgi:fermentation-respiration switch protein FrsA (DUF1100 family)